ncbi:MAG: Asp-tRNA(Asn)/Glu-tRNA(Gln) amidotransferase subunit GatB [Holosporales bacterium]|jgi:aspartyl-tRNA(Asn)/glutamyl-tRNA(Gln) amidotransferase subunit B|nr:Asp-tRNA(Asn)/Glu-tRNA(Gln) amidotransferase subunit GatB [Holosporales bacterium]
MTKMNSTTTIEQLNQPGQPEWEIVIGLEIHAQIASNAKLFSGSAVGGSNAPNSRVSFLDAGMPGILPVVNSKCIDAAIKTGLGLHGTINKLSIFDRKNYFYPDLPSGYQISQFFHPIVSGGYVECADDDSAPAPDHDSDPDNNTVKRFGITRIHLEQDAGKCIHDVDPQKSYVDLNRSGVALMEIVTEPDMRSVPQAVSVAKKIHTLVRYLGVCDGNMELGNFRIDANISVHKPGTPFGTRVEIKNLNSFRFMQAALSYEIERQIMVVESGGSVVQETRLFDSNIGVTSTMREKEDASDYRYFPDPDLRPIILSQDRIQAIKDSMPELPDDRKARLIDKCFLNEYDADIISCDRQIGEFYDAVMLFDGFKDRKAAYKAVANWIIGDLFAAIKDEGISFSEVKLLPLTLAKLVALIQDGTISVTAGKKVFAKLLDGGVADPAEIVESVGLRQISDESEIRAVVLQVINDYHNAAAAYRAGKISTFGFFVGHVMKRFSGRANPDVVNKVLRAELEASPQN